MKVLVIGASRGLGREFVVQYLADRAQVTATARQPADVAALEALGATAFQLDVTNAVSASSLAWRVDNAGFDVAIVNAGVFGPRHTGLDTPTEADFDAVMHTNVLGAMRVIPQLADSFAQGARLAVLSSRMGSIGSRTAAGSSLYRASKAAVNSVVKDAALTYGERVVCIALHPGWVKTDMGGAGADIDVKTSVAGMRKVIDGTLARQSGEFFSYDGAPIPW